MLEKTKEGYERQEWEFYTARLKNGLKLKIDNEVGQISRINMRKERVCRISKGGLPKMTWNWSPTERRERGSLKENLKLVGAFTCPAVKTKIRTDLEQNVICGFKRIYFYLEDENVKEETFSKS